MDCQRPSGTGNGILQVRLRLGIARQARVGIPQVVLGRGIIQRRLVDVRLGGKLIAHLALS